MDIGQLRRWFRLKLATVDTARRACLDQGDIHHQRGRDLEGAAAQEEWDIAEQYHGAAKDLRDAPHEDPPAYVNNGTDSSIHDNAQPVLQATQKLEASPKINISERTLSILAFGLAVAALVISWGLSRQLDSARLASFREIDSARAAFSREVDSLRQYANDQHRATTAEVDFLRRHTEELRIRLEDAQAQLLTANCIRPGDAIHGPLANPNRLKEK